jgi:hypothetical protein
MKLLDYAKKAVTLPPHIFLHRAACKILGMIKSITRNREELRMPSYSLGYRFQCPKQEGLFCQAAKFPDSFDFLGGSFPKSALRKNKPKINVGNRKESIRIMGLIRQPYNLIDWQLDFTSGIRWDENSLSRNLKCDGGLADSAWEVARMQNLACEAGIKEFRNEILDFIATNPPRFGVNWISSVEVSIRVANWLVGFKRLFFDGNSLDDEFFSVFARSVYEHGHHIYHNLEWDPYLRKNGYLINICGLVFAAAFLPSSSDTNSWYKFAERELVSESRSLEINGVNASEKYGEIAGKMIPYARSLLKIHKSTN